jgi:cation diffusion facilitator CzcD-associated flavoprotein CzcO
MGTVEGMRHPIVIVGSGFAGLCMAIRLRRAGITDFVVLEKGDDVGGTWRDNTYPGCACDVESHLYSFSFEPNPRWTRAFAPQREILAYLRHCADKYEIRPHVRFGAEVVGADFDGVWTVRLRDGSSIVARALVLGTGALHRPMIPRLPGIERFRGATFHSARWDHSYDLKGKRVAVIGTGASAIQFVPQIAPQVRALSLLQRTPPWILPKPDASYGALRRKLYELAPLLQKMHRDAIYWRLESRSLGFGAPKVMKLVEVIAKRHLARQIDDAALRQKVTPDYTIGCKRILISNDYYPALARPNVDVITDGVAEVQADAIVTTAGARIEVDAILYGTGFHVSDYLATLDITGVDGRTLNDAWAQGPECYLGMSVHGFPNLFLLLGPNSGLGHNSMIFMIEAQTRYLLEALRTGECIDVRPAVQARFNAQLHARLGHAVWASGCKSWYLDEHGKNRALWPGATWRYWLRTRRFEPHAFRLRQQRSQNSSPMPNMPSMEMRSKPSASSVP